MSLSIVRNHNMDFLLSCWEHPRPKNTRCVQVLTKLEASSAESWIFGMGQKSQNLRPKLPSGHLSDFDGLGWYNNVRHLICLELFLGFYAMLLQQLFIDYSSLRYFDIELWALADLNSDLPWSCVGWTSMCWVSILSHTHVALEEHDSSHSLQKIIRASSLQVRMRTVSEALVLVHDYCRMIMIRTYISILYAFNGNFRNLNWRYPPYIRPM